MEKNRLLATLWSNCEKILISNMPNSDIEVTTTCEFLKLSNYRHVRLPFLILRLRGGHHTSRHVTHRLFTAQVGVIEGAALVMVKSISRTKPAL